MQKKRKKESREKRNRENFLSKHEQRKEEEFCIEKGEIAERSFRENFIHSAMFQVRRVQGFCKLSSNLFLLS